MMQNFCIIWLLAITQIWRVIQAQDEYYHYENGGGEEPPVEKSPHKKALVVGTKKKSCDCGVVMGTRNVFGKEENRRKREVANDSMLKEDIKDIKKKLEDLRQEIEGKGGVIDMLKDRAEHKVEKNKEDDKAEHKVEKNKEYDYFRIVNGYMPDNARPWLALLIIGSNEGQCGGSLVNRRYIITAAHCMCSNLKDDPELCAVEHQKGPTLRQKIKVFLGISKLLEIRGKAGKWNVTDLFLHPKRLELEKAKGGRFSGPFDIAIIKLEMDVMFDMAKIYPICMKPEMQPEEFKMAFVAGFGSVSSNGDCWTGNDLPNPYMPCVKNFTYNGQRYNGTCVVKELPPKTYKACTAALSQLGWFKRFPHGTEEVVITNGKQNISCFDRWHSSYGWCFVKKTNTAKIDPHASWGYCSRHCSMSMLTNDLQEIELTVMSLKDCQTLAKPLGVNLQNEFCAARLNRREHHVQVVRVKRDRRFWKMTEKDVDRSYYGGSDACQGDSGGPIWQYERDATGFQRAYLIGMVSRGTGCAWKNAPGVYTKLSWYYEFIRKVIADGGICEPTLATVV